MKAMLIIDMPRTCAECPCARFTVRGWLLCQRKDENNVMLLYNAYVTKRRSDCPLKLVPNVPEPMIDQPFVD